MQVKINFWKSSENQRNFLKDFAIKFNIQSPHDWGKISVGDIANAGGATLIYNYHNSNIRKALVENFPDIDWKREWFFRSRRFYSKDYWNHPNNTKKFLNEIAKKLDIKKPEDWGNISLQTIKEHKGRYILDKHRGSLFLTLQSVFPETNWKKEWFPYIPTFPPKHWTKKENRREFLDSIKNKLNIKENKDWRRVKISDIINMGGQSLLSKYNRSIFQILEATFPEIQWNKEWFAERKLPQQYWLSLENQRHFLNSIAMDYNILNIGDWNRLTGALIKRRGGTGLLSKYNNSLLQALQRVYNTDFSYENLSENEANLRFKIGILLNK